MDPHPLLLTSAEPPPLRYAEMIEHWSSMATRVMDATSAGVHCRLLLVQCGELKAALVTKAETIAAGIAQVVVEELQGSAEKIGASYNAIHDHLQTSSGSAEDVMAMTEYLAWCEGEMAALQEGIESDLEARLKLLSSLHLSMSDECSAAVYKAFGWPGRVYKVVADAKKKQEEDRLHFQEQLKEDSERFSEELDEWYAAPRLEPSPRHSLAAWP